MILQSKNIALQVLQPVELLLFYSSIDFRLLTSIFSSKQIKILSKVALSIFGETKLTIGTIISPATIANAPALIGDSMNLRNMFDTVSNTPLAKLAHTAALVTPFQYNP